MSAGRITPDAVSLAVVSATAVLGLAWVAGVAVVVRRAWVRGRA